MKQTKVLCDMCPNELSGDSDHPRIHPHPMLPHDSIIQVDMHADLCHRCYKAIEDEICAMILKPDAYKAWRDKADRREAAKATT